MKLCCQAVTGLVLLCVRWAIPYVFQMDQSDLKGVTMETSTQTRKFIFLISLTIAILLSVPIGLITYRYYGVVARGVLGVVLLYLLYYYGRSMKMDVSTNTMLADPNKGKYFVSAFVVPIISYWAFAQVYEMILFFWRR